MKLATYEIAGERRLGAVADDTVVDLNRAVAALARSEGALNPQAQADATVPADAIAFLRGEQATLAAAAQALTFVSSLGPQSAQRERLAEKLADVKLLPPIPAPPKMICIGRNYAKHAQEAGFELSEYPMLFPRFSATLVADGDAVVRPNTISEELDWEGELAIVIGRRGRHISKQDALDHVGGYSVFNDVTVRDYQFRTTQYTAGKNFSDTGPFGPYIVTSDEVPDPHVLDVMTFIDGEQVQHGNTSDLLFDVPTIVSILSDFIELEVGDVIPTGTPSGVGFKRTPPRFLKPGERVRVEIPGIGTLENPIVDEVA